MGKIIVAGARENNLKSINVEIDHNSLTVVTGVSGSGKSSLVFDTILVEAQRKFFGTLTHYSRQALELGSKPSVDSVKGVLPAIGLSQIETLPSKRASIASQTDLNEIFGVLFSRLGEHFCPEHGLKTEALSVENLIPMIIEDFKGQFITVAVELALQKVGGFHEQIKKLRSKGYLKIIVDGKLYDISDESWIDKSKHDVSLCIDFIKVEEKLQDRLLRSIKTASEEGQKRFLVIPFDLKVKRISGSSVGYALKEGCSICGFSFGQLDSRHFSTGSIAKCQGCGGIGYLDDELENLCDSCLGTGISAEYLAIKIDGLSLADLFNMSITSVIRVMSRWNETTMTQNQVFHRLFKEVMSVLTNLDSIGIGYLSLGRRIHTLSTGEMQRVRLAGIFGSPLRNVLYVLDEPSQGLHNREVSKLLSFLQGVRDLGNTILMVDHNELLMRGADQILDLGPGGGEEGGSLMGIYHPTEAHRFTALSPTAALLMGDMPPQSHSSSSTFLFEKFENLRKFYLDIDRISVPRSKLTLISGVSGSGKTTLLREFESHLRELIETNSDLSVSFVDRKPPGRSKLSFPATYFSFFTTIRDLFASVTEAQVLGLDAASFSLSKAGGRCESCAGKGFLTLSMRFLADAEVICSDCRGSRYGEMVNGVKFRGLSLPEILDLTLAEALVFFQNHPKICRSLEPACALGLGYLKVGQPTYTLSGGESQRLKLIPFLSKRDLSHHFFLMDEPTMGLHQTDIHKFAEFLSSLMAKGATVILVDHSPVLMRYCDWHIELGPGAADLGGKLVYGGPPGLV